MASKPVKPTLFPDMSSAKSTALWKKYAQDVINWNLDNPHDPIRIEPGSEEEVEFRFAGVYTPELLSISELYEHSFDLSEKDVVPSISEPYEHSFDLSEKDVVPPKRRKRNPYDVYDYDLSEEDLAPLNPTVVHHSQLTPLTALPGDNLTAIPYDQPPMQGHGPIGNSALKSMKKGGMGKLAGQIARVAGGDVGAAMEMVMDEINTRVKAMSSVPGNLMDAMKADSVGGTMSKGFEGMENLGRATRGSGIGELMEGLGFLGKTVFGAVDALEKLGKSLMDANFKFAEWSGSMAQLKFQQEAFDILISKSKGDARAESAQRLQNELNKLTETLTPLENQLANAKNEIMGAFVRGLNRLEENTGAVKATVDFLEKTFGLKPGDFKESEYIAAIAEMLGDPTDPPKRFDVR